MLECIGKYIGLDRLLCETGIYGECTLLNSILGRKNKKMGMEAHTTMYLALYHLYLKEASQKRPDMVSMLEKSALTMFCWKEIIKKISAKTTEKK